MLIVDTVQVTFFIVPQSSLLVVPRTKSTPRSLPEDFRSRKLDSGFHSSPLPPVDQGPPSPTG